MYACILTFNLPQSFEKGAASLPSERDIPVLKSPLLTLHLWGSAWSPQPLLPYLIILLPTPPLLFLNVSRSFEPALSSSWTSFPSEGHVASPLVSLCPYWNVTNQMRAFVTAVLGTLTWCTRIPWAFTSLDDSLYSMVCIIMGCGGPKLPPNTHQNRSPPGQGLHLLCFCQHAGLCRGLDANPLLNCLLLCLAGLLFTIPASSDLWTSSGMILDHPFGILIANGLVLQLEVF